MEKGFLHSLLRTKQTVFSFKELMLLWGGLEHDTARARVHYYVKKGQLIHLRRGLYAKDIHYDKFELATKIMAPSYISLETVLGMAGINFQHYDRIFVITYKSRDISCDNTLISTKTVKESILTDATGIEQREAYAIASPERAFLDVLYLNRDYHFVNLSPLNWNKIHTILPVYEGHKRMNRLVEGYWKSSLKGK